jgi:hypothetical protein
MVNEENACDEPAEGTDWDLPQGHAWVGEAFRDPAAMFIVSSPSIPLEENDDHERQVHEQLRQAFLRSHAEVLASRRSWWTRWLRRGSSG